MVKTITYRSSTEKSTLEIFLSNQVHRYINAPILKMRNNAAPCSSGINTAKEILEL